MFCSFFFFHFSTFLLDHFVQFVASSPQLMIFHGINVYQSLLTDSSDGAVLCSVCVRIMTVCLSCFTQFLLMMHLTSHQQPANICHSCLQLISLCCHFLLKCSSVVDQLKQSSHITLHRAVVPLEICHAVTD